ncbi:spore coat protein U domain-containing protein [Ramlibacter sp.]|uniref:spore coat protein U domain-containing protein n=1 Tax=Ramlibacter sp. TaxID=1917967 RepID=UPI003D1250A8
MKRWILKAAMAAALASGAGAALAQSCNIVSASASSTNAYDPFSSTSNDTQGSVRFSCSRGWLQTQFPSTFWVGVSSSTGNLASGANSLPFQLSTNYAACSQAWGGNSGDTVSNAQTSWLYTNIGPLTSTFCFRIPGGQSTAAPGTYTHNSLTVTIRSSNSSGRVWGTGTLSLAATVDPACDFTTDPSPLVINYTSFQTTPGIGTSNFQLRCTRTTPYQLSVESGGSLLDLGYSLAVNASSALGTGNAQSYTITGTAPAGQSGTCASGAGCQATQARTLTITY